MGKVEEWAEDQEKRVSAAASPTGEMDEKATLRPQSMDDAIVSPISARPPPTELFPFPPPPPIPDSETQGFDFATKEITNSTNGSNDNGNGNGNPARARTVTISEPNRHPSMGRAHANALNAHNSGRKARRRATTKSSTRAFHHTDENALLEKEDAKQVLELIQGHLVVWPYEWLEKEESGGGWLYTVDQIAPLEIYT
jgi:phospholipase D1/2